MSAPGRQVRVAPGDVATVAVTVTAGDGQAERRYAVEVTHPGPVSEVVTTPETTPETDVCGRTGAVRDAIVAAVRSTDSTVYDGPSAAGVTACEHVTAAHLAGVRQLDFAHDTVEFFKTEDFAGLTGLTALDLSDTVLLALAPGVFAGLSRLEALDLRENNLRSLPADIFAGLSRLETLDLRDNELRGLPDGIFEALGALSTLKLAGNPGSAGYVPAASAGADRTVAPGAAVALDGRASTATGPWRSNVTWRWEQVDADGGVVDPPAVTLTRADTATPSFTAPEPPGAVRVRLTVTGRGTAGGGTAHYRASDAVEVTVSAPGAMRDATLARLAVSHGEAASPVALLPAFSPGTGTYRATLAQGIAQATVEAERSQPGARVAFEGGMDADPDTAGHQVTLAPGGNTVRVRVTAPNRADVMLYTLTLTRRVAGRLASLSVAGSDGGALALAPAFSPHAVRYRVVAPPAAERVTVRASAAGGAAIAWSPADADAAPGHQVAPGSAGRLRL